jgi:hypothetical protein
MGYESLGVFFFVRVARLSLLSVVEAPALACTALGA